MKIYLVGGAVRDGLLGLAIKDHDWVVVGATPELMLRHDFIQVGKDFPVFLHPKTHEEYALARTERKVGTGYKGFDFYTGQAVTLADDLLRRDLTINAIAFDYDKFKRDHPECLTPSDALVTCLDSQQTSDNSHYFYDPYKGIDDLNHKVLRHVSDAFIEDPLRILRVARFYAQFYTLGFKIAEETHQLIGQIVDSGELSALTKERIWLETIKALSTNSPSIYFKYLDKLGALDRLFPILTDIEAHHALIYLDIVATKTRDPVMRFATLAYKVLSNPQQTQLTDKRQFNKLLDTLRIGNEYKDMLWLIASQHDKWASILTYSAESLLHFLENTGMLKVDSRLSDFSLICQVLFEEDNSLTDKKYALLEEIILLVNNIDISSLIDSGLKGLDMKNAIHALRVNAVNDLLNRKYLLSIVE